MTFDEFRIVLEGTIFGNKKVREDKYLIPLVNQALKQIAIDAEPITLVSSDIRDDILVILEDGDFIRVPNEITVGTDELDIDEFLIFAVVHFTASFIVHKDDKEEKKDDAQKIVSDYNWMKYNSTKAMCNE